MEQVPVELSSLNAIQELNLSLLTLVRDAARSDLAAACCMFGIDVDDLRQIGKLTPADVVRIVARVGDQALFEPRSDLASLLTTSPALLPVLASARPGKASKSRPASPRS
jgi:hypothetical protein